MEEAVDAKDAGRLAVLVQNRLGGDGQAAAALLLAAGQAVKAVKAVKASPAQSPLNDAFHAELLRLSGVSGAVPRGRFDLVFSSKGLALVGKAANLGPIPWADILHVFRLPKPETYRKAGTPARSYHLVLPLRSSVTLGKQSICCVVLNADGAKPLAQSSLSLASQSANDQDSENSVRAKLEEKVAALSGEEAEHAALAQLLAAAKGGLIEDPDPGVCQLESVRAYRGVEEGALYPLRSGLCFLPRPALFLSAADIAQVSAGQAGGGRASSSRTEVVVRAAGSSPIVFSNVAVDDVRPLLQYASELPTRDATKEPAASATGVLGHSCDDPEEADEDFEPECDDSSEEPQPSRRSTGPQRKRAARTLPNKSHEPVAKRTRSKAPAAAPTELCLLDKVLDKANQEILALSTDSDEAGSP